MFGISHIDVDLEAVLAALADPSSRHRLRGPASRLLDAPAEGSIEHDVGQTHLFAHPLHRAALQGEALRVGGVRVARGAAEAEHRVRFSVGSKPAAAEQAGVLVGLEVRHPHDHRLGIEGGGDRADPFREALHEEVGRSAIALRQRDRSSGAPSGSSTRSGCSSARGGP